MWGENYKNCECSVLQVFLRKNSIPTWKFSMGLSSPFHLCCYDKQQKQLSKCGSELLWMRLFWLRNGTFAEISCKWRGQILKQRELLCVKAHRAIRKRAVLTNMIVNRNILEGACKMSPQQSPSDLCFFFLTTSSTPYNKSTFELFIPCVTISKKEWWFLLMCVFPTFRVWNAWIIFLLTWKVVTWGVLILGSLGGFLNLILFYLYPRPVNHLGADLVVFPFFNHLLSELLKPEFIQLHWKQFALIANYLLQNFAGSWPEVELWQNPVPAVQYSRTEGGVKDSIHH